MVVFVFTNFYGFNNIRIHYVQANLDVRFTVHFESSSNVAIKRCEHLPRKPLQDGQNFHQFINRKKSVTTSNHTGLVLFLAISQIFVHIVIYMTYYVFRCNSNHSLSVGKENLSRNSIIKAHMAHFPMS